MSQNINYVAQFNAAYADLMGKPNCDPRHISIYVAFFHQWNKLKWPDEMHLDWDILIHVTKIGSRKTIQSKIKDLDAWGLLKYKPSNNPIVGSKVTMVRFYQSSDQSSAQTTDQSHYEEVPGFADKTGNSVEIIKDQIGQTSFLAPNVKYSSHYSGNSYQSTDQSSAQTTDQSPYTIIDNSYSYIKLPNNKQKIFLEIVRFLSESFDSELLPYVKKNMKVFSRWVKQKNSQSVRDSKAFTELKKIWIAWFEQNNDGALPEFNAAEAANLKKLVGSLRRAIESRSKAKGEDLPKDMDLRVIDSFKLILANWDHYSGFVKEKQTIRIIYSQFNEIIGAIKKSNGKPDGQSSPNDWRRAGNNRRDEKGGLLDRFVGGS